MSWPGAVLLLSNGRAFITKGLRRAKTLPEPFGAPLPLADTLLGVSFRIGCSQLPSLLA